MKYRVVEYVSNMVKEKVIKLAKAFNDHCVWRTHLDFMCDECNDTMRPGGHFETKIGTRKYQFCSEKCMEAYKAKHEIPQD